MNTCLSAPFKTLRVSLTDQCDLRCLYCVDPKATPQVVEHLTPAQLAAAVGLLLRNLPLTKLKLTGGEPLLGHRLEQFLDALGPQPNLEISLTTNAQQLKQKLEVIQRHQIKRINISLDSLDEGCFSKLTGGALHKTLEGLEAALEAGFQVKLNMVPMRGINDQECLDLFEFAAKRGVQLRYIELMDMGHLCGSEFGRRLFDRGEILAQIREKHTVTESARPNHDTAQVFEVVGVGNFGIIANHSKPFCDDCNRLRLSSAGDLVGCLSSAFARPIKDLLDLAPDDADQAVKPLLHAAFGDKQTAGFTGSKLVMKAIGG